MATFNKRLLSSVEPNRLTAWAPGTNQVFTNIDAFCHAVMGDLRNGFKIADEKLQSQEITRWTELSEDDFRLIVIGLGVPHGWLCLDSTTATEPDR